MSAETSFSRQGERSDGRKGEHSMGHERLNCLTPQVSAKSTPYSSGNVLTVQCLTLQQKNKCEAVPLMWFIKKRFPLSKCNTQHACAVGISFQPTLFLITCPGSSI